MEDYLEHALLVVDQEEKQQPRPSLMGLVATVAARVASAFNVAVVNGVPAASVVVDAAVAVSAVALRADLNKEIDGSMTVSLPNPELALMADLNKEIDGSMTVSLPNPDSMLFSGSTNFSFYNWPPRSFSTWPPRGVCCVLVEQLRRSAAIVRSLPRFTVIGRNELIVKEYYRVVTDASRLLSCYREKPWLNSAIMLLDTKEDFRSILVDLDLCMRAMSTDYASAYNARRNPESLPSEPYLNYAAEKERRILRSKLLKRSQGRAATKDRLLSDYLLNRMVMNDAKTQDGSLQPFVWNPDPQAIVGALLGSGSSGSVHKFTWFGLECAKKCFVCRTEAEERVFQKEVGVMACLNHPNVVKFICCHRDLDERAIVMEYMPMNLQGFIDQRVASSNTEFPFTPMAALDMISQIASGMEYLHGKKVVHRDLKPHNILVSPFTSPELLTADGYAKLKLCDFGLAKSIVTSQSEQQSLVCGTRSYMAPEASPRGGAPVPLQYRTKEADVYSFAIVCSQILSGAEEPFPCPWNGFIARISAPTNERPELPLNVYPAKLLELINKCWDPDPHQRPSFSVICESLKEIKIELLRM